MENKKSFWLRFLNRITTSKNPQEASLDTWSNYYPVEFLLPQIRKDITVKEFPFIEEKLENPSWNESALEEKIRSLGPWAYYFPFSHGLTTQPHGRFLQHTIDLHRYRSSLISETVVELLGDEITEATILDLACHCGVFSLDLAHRGAKHVHGIDVREKNLNQAEFLREYYSINNATFTTGDVYNLSNTSYDVILCLGIMYHLVRPIDLMEHCYNNAKKFVVIDTMCHKQPISAYVVVGDKDVEKSIEGTRQIELQPTYRGIIETMQQVGFKNIVEVVGTSNTPVRLYSDYSRRCFIGFK